MPKHRESEITKKRIIEACRELFYEKGYDETTFNDISRATGVLVGSISYHFKKDEIKEIIYDEITDRLIEEVGQYVELDRPLTTVALINDFIMYKIFADVNFRRFYLASPAGPVSLLSFDKYKNFFNLYKRISNTEITEFSEATEISFALAYGIDKGMGFYLSEYMDKFQEEKNSYMDAADIYTRMYATIFKINAEAIEIAIAESRAILERVDFSSLNFTF